MKNFISFAIILCPFLLFSQNPKENLAIIPQPVSMVQTGGTFVLSKNTVVEVNGMNADVESVAKMFIARVAPATGYSFQIKKGNGSLPNSIRFIVKKEEDKLLGNEGYRLSVKANNVTIIAAKPAGLFYGMQTLVQLFTADIESKTKVNKKAWSLPTVDIVDYPRFA